MTSGEVREVDSECEDASVLKKEAFTVWVFEKKSRCVVMVQSLVQLAIY